MEACSAWAAWRCESASACGGIGGTWKGGQCEAPCSAASDWEHCPTAEACARGGGTWRGYAVVPPGITGSISVPVSGNGSEVLDWVEEACDAGGYTGVISVACEAVASSRSALAVPSTPPGRCWWCPRGRKRGDYYEGFLIRATSWSHAATTIPQNQTSNAFLWSEML